MNLAREGPLVHAAAQDRTGPPEDAALPAPIARAMSFCAPLSFGVYLLHAHPLVWSHLLSGRTAFLAQFSTPLCLAGALAVGLAIFAVGIGADYVRSLLFRAGARAGGRLRAGRGAPVN